MKQRTDIYQKITNQIIAALERGPAPWVKPWNGEHMAGRISRPVRHNLEPYNGVNIISLWASADYQGFNAPVWMTYRQATALGGQVRKGSKGSPVVYASKFVKKERDEETGEDVERTIPFLKGYTVFNVEQVADLPESYYRVKESTLTPLERNEARGAVLQRHWRGSVAWRKQGFLPARRGLDPDAPVQRFPGRIELLQHPCP